MSADVGRRVEQSPKLPVCLVIGAGDIGRVCALELSSAGYAILAVDRDEHACLACVRDVTDQGGTARALVADLGEGDSGAAVIGEAVSMGTVTAMLFGIAWEEHGTALEITAASVAQSLIVGPIAAYSLAQGFAQHVIGAGASGAITLLGSLHGELPLPGAIGYNVAQAALRHLCLSLARELTSRGVRVNMVVPGWVRTRGEESWYTDKQLADLGEKFPLRRMAQPWDIAAAVRYVTTAEYVSGAVLRVDGGLGLYSVNLPDVGTG